MDKKIEPLYNVLKEKANAFTKEEIYGLIITEGYTEKIAKDIIKELEKNKIQFKGDKQNNTQIKENLKEQEKSKKEILKELEKSVKVPEQKPVKKEKKPFKNPLIPVVTFFKKIYYFFEDFYYSIIDKVSKVIPINKVTDEIDKIFPSFIFSLVLIVAIILLLLFSGIFSPSVSFIDVTVTDTTNSLISNAAVVLSINDNNTTKETNAFGNVLFEDLKLRKKDNVVLFVSKEAYNPVSKKLDPKKIINETIILDIDTRAVLLLSEEQTREIIFKENDELVVTKLLQVKFTCSNSGKIPEPSVTNITTGRKTVTQPQGCGFLRVDVTSDYYNLIQNQIVPENNIVMLTLKTQANVGKIETFVKDLQNNSITGATVNLYKANDSTTLPNESNQLFRSGTSDYYGRFIFEDLPPGNYTLSSSKDGYISSQRTSEFTVTKNNTTTVNLLLFSIQDLQNIDCLNPIYSQFCKNNCLACDINLLSDYYLRNQYGNLIRSNNCCQIGTLGYINVTLVDANGEDREIKGDISLYKKRIDSNGYQVIETKRDVNVATFYTVSGNFKIMVTNTEDYGYFPSDPIDINGIDKNIIVPLEYSSVLNTGIIGVNVKRNSYNYGGALVYLYNEKDTDIPINSPKITNASGDVNFPMIRSNNRYFAFSIAGDYQGISSTRTLDANELLELNINLDARSTILNLNVNVKDYNVSFYTQTNRRITDYTVNNVSDSNKEYIFQNPENDIYAVISATNKATYQTDIITLIPGQKIYYKIILDNIKANAYANLEFLGLYDESGTFKLDALNITEYRNKTLKLKYKFTTTTKENRDLSQVLVAVGKSLSLSADYLRLETVFAPGTTFTRGCNYHGATTDWNEEYFISYYNIDNNQTNCTNDTGYKWVKISFSNVNADQIEFSVDFKFQNGLTQLDNYVVYYKALAKAKNNDTYVFSPTINQTWDNCYIRPNGFFYTPFNFYQINFSTTGFDFIYNLYDWNNSLGNLLEPNGSCYELEITKKYFSKQNLLYLTNQSISDKKIKAHSTNTLNNLIYNSYSLKAKNISGENIKSVNVIADGIVYEVFDISAQFGTEIDHNSVFSVNNFFKSNVVAQINNDILDLSGTNLFNKNILAYHSGDVFIEIITNSYDDDNNIYAGDNNLSFRVRDKTGNPIPNITIKYQLSTEQEIELGKTNNQGLLEDKNISFAINKIGEKIKFKFSDFPVTFGFQNNTVLIEKTIKSGYKLTHENKQLITLNNPLIYDVGKYIINNEENILVSKKNYYIVKSTAYRPLLDIIFNSSAEYINTIDTNAYLHNNNGPLPTLISDENKITKTQLSFKNLPSAFSNNIIGNYNNILNIGTLGEGDIILDLNAGFKIERGLDVNLTIIPKNINKPGFSVSNKSIFIELIKDINPSVDFNYTIKNDSNVSVSLEINPPEINGLNITVNPSYITIPINGSKEVNVKYEYLNNDSINKVIPLDFNFIVGGTSFNKDFNNIVRTYNPSDIYSLKINSQNTPITLPLSCSKTECKLDLLNTIENKTITYDFNLYEINFSDSDNNFNIVTTLLPNLINNSNSFDFSSTITGNYNTLKGNLENTFIVKNKKINYKFKLKELNIPFDVNVNLTLNTTIISQSINELLEEQGLYGNLCLGFGSSGDVNATNFDIIGVCEIEGYNKCKSGASEKPKILLDWGENSQLHWLTECIDLDPYDYNTNKTHCDSAQMLISVFKYIQNNQSTDLENGIYIYLMADGVSKDLLIDINKFLDYSESNNSGNVFLFPIEKINQNNVFAINRINDGDFTIQKYEKINEIDVNTTKPGKYKLTINDNFDTGHVSPLNITLELVREMPYTMRNLLYYIPIDGPLGIDDVTKQTKRNGYGASLIGDNDVNLLIISSNPGLYLYNSNTQHDSFVKITMDTQNTLLKTLNSDGKLLNINLDNINADGSMALTLDYTPSHPMPMYAGVFDSNVSGLNYRLVLGNNPYPLLLPNSLIKWTDYNASTKILSDVTIKDTRNLYYKSQILPSSFKSNYTNNINKVLLKTILYWPINQKNQFVNLSFDLSNLDLQNSNLTKIYTLSNLDNNGSKVSGTFNSLSKVNLSNVISYKDLFDLVYMGDSNICMESGLTNIMLKWKKEVIDFNSEEKDLIINNFYSDNENENINNNETIK